MSLNSCLPELRGNVHADAGNVAHDEIRLRVLRQQEAELAVTVAVHQFVDGSLGLYDDLVPVAQVVQLQEGRVRLQGNLLLLRQPETPSEFLSESHAGGKLGIGVDLETRVDRGH